MKVVAVTGYKPFELGIFKNDHPGVDMYKKGAASQINCFCRRRFGMGYYKRSIRSRAMGC